MQTTQPKGSIVGREVYDRINKVMGTVLREDGICLVIEFSDGEKTYQKLVTYATFRQYYKVVKREGDEQIFTTLENRPVEDRPMKRRKILPEHKGESGCGSELSNLFNTLVKYRANQDLEFKINKYNLNTYVIKYNGKTIFDCTITDYNFQVLAHPKSLSPQSKKYMVKEFDKKTNWALRSQFIFTNKSQKALMNSIISDGLYFRQIIEVLDRKENNNGTNNL